MPGPGEKDTPAKTTPWGSDEPTLPANSPPLSNGSSETGTLIDTGALLSLSQRYDVLEEIGRGGMGVVYRAQDRETGDVVALKVLLPEIASRTELIERFKSELLLARKVTHTNVCRVHDLNRLGTVVAISMEYVEGESLRAFLRRYGNVSVRRGLEWVGQICSALGEAHRQGVIHRDLKPENILITREGAVKVMDFGIARSVEALTAQTVGIIGTPAYMSPEQAEGKPADARSDIYSLGLMMYEMFTGQPAFRAETPVAMVAKHVHETPPPPREVEPDLPERIGRAIQKCLEKNPKKRFQSVAELDAALREKLEAVTTPIPPAQELSLPVHLAHWQRTDSFLLAGALVAVFVFFLVFRALHPAGAMEVTVTAQEAQQIAQDAVNRLGWNDQVSKAGLLGYWHWDFYSLWEQRGGKAARSADWDIPGWSGWSPSLHYRVSGKGNLREVGKIVDWSKPQPRPSTSASEQQRVQVAVGAVKAAFGRDLSAVEPSKTTPSFSSNKNLVTAVSWRVSAGQGYQDEQIRVSLHNEVPYWISVWHEFAYDPSVHGWLRQAYSFGGATWLGLLHSALANAFPTAYQRAAHFRSFFVIPLLVGLAVTLLVRKRVWRSWSCWSDKIFAVVFAAILTAASLPEIVSSVKEGPTPAVAALKVLYPLIYFILSLCLVYAILATVSYYLVRRSPEQVVTYAELFRKGLRAESAGLAIVRGAAIGWVFIASCLLLVGLSQVLHWVVPSVEWLDLTVPSQFPQFRDDGLPTALVMSAVVLTEAFIATWLLTALPFALLRNATRSRVVMVAACALVWCVAAFSLLGATFYSWLPFYAFAAVQAVAITATLVRFDLLTSFFAVVTVETWLLAWPGYVTFYKLDTLQYIVVLSVWLLLLLWGLVLYFRPQLALGWRRVAAVFE